MCGSVRRSSGRANRLRMNNDSCLHRNMPKQLQQIAPAKRHAARSRCKAMAGDMDEHGAATPRHPRPPVVVDLDNKIIEAVVPSKPVAWFSGRPTERAVIAAIRRIFTPCVARPDAADGQQGRRSRRPIGPPPQPDRAKPADGCSAVSLPFIGFDGASAQRDPQRLRPAGHQPALPTAARTGTYMNETDRFSPHRDPDSQSGLAPVS